MILSLKGKHALVGGSSKGIGRAVAVALSELGASLTLIARNPEHLSVAMEDLVHAPGQHHDFIVADFADRQALKKKVDGLIAQKTIHILVNNTGGPPAGNLLDAEIPAFIQAYNNHLLCNHLLAKALLPGMISAGYGRIINIISTSVKQPIDGLGVSNTTRGAVANWAKTLANEVGVHGVTVNNVLPGFTRTERAAAVALEAAKNKGVSREEIFKEWERSIPLRRIGEPEEIAAAVAFLASPAASYISGVNLPVDGGKTKSL